MATLLCYDDLICLGINLYKLFFKINLMKNANYFNRKRGYQQFRKQKLGFERFVIQISDNLAEKQMKSVTIVETTILRKKLQSTEIPLYISIFQLENNFRENQIDSNFQIFDQIDSKSSEFTDCTEINIPMEDESEMKFFQSTSNERIDAQWVSLYEHEQ